MESVVVFDGRQPPGEVGHFSYHVSDDLWSWSDGLFAMHGYVPGEVPATTAVLLRHKHPDDRDRAAEALAGVIAGGGQFSCYHRILDRHERVHSVLSVGRGIRGEGGRVDVVEGFFVDLTSARRAETEAEVQAALAGLAQHRATIDQAKGMVMLAMGLESNAAFERLRKSSQDTNRKLHDVARLLVDGAGADRRGPDFVTQVLEGSVAREN